MILYNYLNQNCLVRPAVRVRSSRRSCSSQCGWWPRLSLGRQPIHAHVIFGLLSSSALLIHDSCENFYQVSC